MLHIQCPFTCMGRVKQKHLIHNEPRNAHTLTRILTPYVYMQNIAFESEYLQLGLPASLLPLLSTVQLLTLDLGSNIPKLSCFLNNMFNIFPEIKYNIFLQIIVLCVDVLHSLFHEVLHF